jgi:hypothetical protein
MNFFLFLFSGFVVASQLPYTPGAWPEQLHQREGPQVLCLAHARGRWVCPQDPTHQAFRCRYRTMIEHLMLTVNNIIYFNLTPQYYKWMKSFLSLFVWKKGDESIPKMPSGSGWESNPGPLAASAPLRINLYVIIYS